MYCIVQLPLSFGMVLGGAPSNRGSLRSISCHHMTRTTICITHTKRNSQENCDFGCWSSLVNQILTEFISLSELSEFPLCCFFTGFLFKDLFSNFKLFFYSTPLSIFGCLPVFQWLMFLKGWNFVSSFSFLVRHLNIAAIGFLQWNVEEMGDQYRLLNLYATEIIILHPIPIC